MDKYFILKFGNKHQENNKYNFNSNKKLTIKFKIILSKFNNLQLIKENV